MTNEELAAMVQAGDRERLMELWGQTRRLVLKYANRWAAAGSGGAEIEDLTQAAFIAVMRAVETFDPAKAKFSTYLVFYLKSEFSRATGWRAGRECRDPLQSAVSLDTPLDDKDDSSTFGDLIPDPAAEAEIAHTDIRLAVAAVLMELPEAQRRAIEWKYWYDRPVDQKAHAAALRYLRHPSRSKLLKNLLDF